MSKGKQVTCGRCTKKYNIYDDIQSKVNGRLVSVCPYCNNVEGHNFEHPFLFDYNAGDGVDGVGQHLDGEDNYDWEWMKYNTEHKTEVRDYDQDDDLISNNLGFED